MSCLLKQLRWVRNGSVWQDGSVGRVVVGEVCFLGVVNSAPALAHKHGSLLRATECDLLAPLLLWVEWFAV